jgi:hypothetical protein
MEIGDQVVVDFDIEGVLTPCRGKIVEKGRNKKSWKIFFEDGDTVDVPFNDVKLASSQKNRERKVLTCTQKFESTNTLNVSVFGSDPSGDEDHNGDAEDEAPSTSGKKGKHTTAPKDPPKKKSKVAKPARISSGIKGKNT